MRIDLAELRDISREVEGYNLAGELWELGQSPYDVAISQAEQAITDIRQYIADLEGLRAHIHDWNSADYCSVCGADGRG